MICEAGEDMIWSAFCVSSFGEALVKAGDGFADGVGGALSVTALTFTVLFLEFDDGFEFSQGFLFDGFGFVFIVDDGFEFLLLSQDDV
jgi:hypothetical protein